MKKIVIVCLIAVLSSVSLYGETQTNGSVTLSSVGDDTLVIMLHARKKMLVYQVNQRVCALKAVRTWHYDAQLAYGIKTGYHSGVYPRETMVDSQANPIRLQKWMKAQGYTFNPNYTVQGLGRGGSGGGGDVTVSFQLSRANGLVVILDAENYALLVYEVNPREIKFCLCRSILAEVQIPFHYPGRVTKPSPLEVRSVLQKLEKEINKNNPQIPFVIKEVKELGAIPNR